MAFSLAAAVSTNGSVGDAYDAKFPAIQSYRPLRRKFGWIRGLYLLLNRGGLGHARDPTWKGPYRLFARRVGSAGGIQGSLCC